MNNAPGAEAPKSVGGWLLLLCIGLVIVSPLHSLLTFLLSFEGSKNLFSDIPELKTLFGIDGILSLGVVGFSIYAGQALWRRRSGAVQTVKMFLAVALTYSVLALFLPFLLPPEKRENAVLVAAGLKQVLPGVLSIGIWYFYLGRSKRVEATYPDSGARLDPSVAVRLAGIREHSQIFASRAGPMNWYLFLSFLVASVFEFFLYPVAYSIMGATISRPLSGYALAFGHIIVETIVFLLLLYGLRRVWQLVVAWGVASIVIKIGYLAARRAMHADGTREIAVFDFEVLTITFLYAALFAAGLTLAIRHFGARFSSLVLGIGASIFAAGLASTGYYAIADGSAFSGDTLILHAVNGVIFGALVYAGLHLHWQRVAVGQEQPAG